MSNLLDLLLWTVSASVFLPFLPLQLHLNLQPSDTMHIFFIMICHIYYYPFSSFMLLIHLTHHGLSLLGNRKVTHVYNLTRKIGKSVKSQERWTLKAKKVKKKKRCSHITTWIYYHLQIVGIRPLHKTAKDEGRWWQLYVCQVTI